MRRVNILADKALLAAFVENTHGIETRHVQAAIRDTELGPAATTRWQQKHTIMTAALAAAILLAAAGWYLGRSQAHDAATSLTMPITRITPASVPVATAAIEPATAQNSVDTQDVKLHMSPSLSAAPVANTSKASTALPAPAPQESLLDQRIASAKKQLAFSAPGSASIQLYYTDNVKPARIEAFLKRADSQGALNNIYIYPIKINGRKGYRVLYGIYPNSEKARSGMRQLPQRFRDSFAPTIFLLEDLPTP
jgi:hypothetical protein